MEQSDNGINRVTIGLRSDAESRVKYVMRKLGIKRSPAINLLIMRAPIEAITGETMPPAEQKD